MWNIQGKEKESQSRHAASNTHCEMHHLKEKWKKWASMYKDLLHKFGICIPTETAFAPSMGPFANGLPSPSPALVWIFFPTYDRNLLCRFFPVSYGSEFVLNGEWRFGLFMFMMTTSSLEGFCCIMLIYMYTFVVSSFCVRNSWYKLVSASITMW